MLRRLEVPLALAVIIAGIGSAAVQIIATVTLGAIFGFGGLGAYLIQGISQNDDGMVFGGVVLVALLALAAEALFTLLARRARPPGAADTDDDDRRRAEPAPGSAATSAPI